jgi:hypothetical protein
MRLTRGPEWSDSEPQYQDGAFDGSLRSRMSDELQRKLAQTDEQEQREAAQIEHERAVHADEQRERAIQALVREARERGEAVSLQQRADGRGLGKLPSEFVAERVALMDLEDAREDARRRAEFRRWELQQSDDLSHDSSKWEAERAEQRAWAEEWGPKVEAQRARRRETAGMIRADRKLREMGFRGV